MRIRVKGTLVSLLTLAVLLASSFSAALLVPSSASAGTLNQFCKGIATGGAGGCGGTDSSGNPAPDQVEAACAPNDTNCAANSDRNDSKIQHLLVTAVNILSLVVGVVAVIMIIVSGFRFMTSGGESSKVESAKNGILYAIIGIIIVALAQIIIRFVVNRALGAVSNG
jgi:hypothetical protein